MHLKEEFIEKYMIINECLSTKSSKKQYVNETTDAVYETINGMHVKKNK